MIVGGYSLDCYCDCDPATRREAGIAHRTLGHDGEPHIFYGRTKGECLRKARTAGWLIRSDGSALAPGCRKAGRTIRSER